MVTNLVVCAIITTQLGTAAGRHNVSSRETDVVRAVRTAKDAVVNISTTQVARGLDEDIFLFFSFPRFVPRKSHSLGSGFVIHPSGYIVTNAHVVQQASESTEISVSFADETTLQARKIGSDFEDDVAIIKIETSKALQALRLGNGDDLMIGETVIAIGNPLGYQHSVTTGVISAVDRELSFRTGQVYRRLIQTDASINPGNSGGPLLNINGNLIGVNTAIRGDAQNIGFAINVETLKRLLPKLFDVERLRRIDLGFAVAPMRNSRHLRVVSVTSGSPADESQLAAGDVVVGFDDEPLQDPVDFYVAMYERPVGRRLTLMVRRGDRDVSIEMPFEKRPKPDGKKLLTQRLGIVAEEISARRGGKLVIVRSVARNSPAEKIGLRRNDVIDQLDRYHVRTLDEVGQALEDVKPAQRIYVGIVRVGEGVYYRSGTYVKVR